MHHGIVVNPQDYPGLSAHSQFAEFQTVLNAQGREECAQPCSLGPRFSGIPGISLDFPTSSIGREMLSFYMYRAEDDSGSNASENVNAADLAGVLEHVHAEVAASKPGEATRRHNISRIRRFRVTILTTWEYYNVHRRQFGAYVEFKGAKCQLQDCDMIWQHYGFVVGCELKMDSASGYVVQSRTNLAQCE